MAKVLRHQALTIAHQFLSSNVLPPQARLATQTTAMRCGLFSSKSIKTAQASSQNMSSVAPSSMATTQPSTLIL